MEVLHLMPSLAIPWCDERQGDENVHAEPWRVRIIMQISQQAIKRASKPSKAKESTQARKHGRD